MRAGGRIVHPGNMNESNFSLEEAVEVLRRRGDLVIAVDHEAVGSPAALLQRVEREPCHVCTAFLILAYSYTGMDSVARMHATVRDWVRRQPGRALRGRIADEVHRPGGPRGAPA